MNGATLPVTILPSDSDYLGLGAVQQRSIEALTFDAVISEAHTSEMEVTENPIETGVSIADHCYMKPLKVTIQAAVSELKMPSAPSLYDGSPSGRVRQAYQMLQQLQLDCTTNALQPFSVATGLVLYQNMVCTSLSATQDAASASLLSFTAELTQVTVLTTQTVGYTPAKPMPGKPKQQAGDTKKDADKKPQEPTKAQTDSMLEGLIGMATGKKPIMNPFARPK